MLGPAVGGLGEWWVESRPQPRDLVRQRVGEILVLALAEAVAGHHYRAAKPARLIQPGELRALLGRQDGRCLREPLGVECVLELGPGQRRDTLLERPRGGGLGHLDLLIDGCSFASYRRNVVAASDVRSLRSAGAARGDARRLAPDVEDSRNSIGSPHSSLARPATIQTRIPTPRRRRNQLTPPTASSSAHTARPRVKTAR